MSHLQSSDIDEHKVKSCGLVSQHFISQQHHYQHDDLNDGHYASHDHESSACRLTTRSLI